MTELLTMIKQPHNPIVHNYTGTIVCSQGRVFSEMWMHHLRHM